MASFRPPPSASLGFFFPRTRLVGRWLSTAQEVNLTADPAWKRRPRIQGRAGSGSTRLLGSRRAVRRGSLRTALRDPSGSNKRNCVVEVVLVGFEGRRKRQLWLEGLQKRFGRSLRILWSSGQKKETSGLYYGPFRRNMADSQKVTRNNQGTRPKCSISAR